MIAMTTSHKSTFQRLFMISVCVFLVILHQVYQVITIECGTVNLARPRIFGGNKTLKGEWPFLATIYKQSHIICGGTIISNRHILTAAHCMKPKSAWYTPSPHEVTVRLGTYNITNQSEEGAVQMNVSKIVIHPDWKAFHRSYDADIAILVLSENIIFTNEIQPVCMPTDDLRENSEGVVVGWGVQENGKMTEIPKQASVKAINASKCLRESDDLTALTSERSFCGGDGDGPGTGDSGGGFFFMPGFAWVQYGIVSTLQTNETGHVIPNMYHAYTNLTQFKNWTIEKVYQTGGEVGVEALRISMKCKFSFSRTFHSNRPIYKCELYDIDIHRSNVQASQFVGLHSYRKTNVDVRLIHFRNGTMSNLPERFGFFFENIKRVIIGDDSSYNSQTLGTKIIRRSNLKNLENLMEISFLRNDIVIFSEDSLWDLPNLRNFIFIEKKLKELQEKTFFKNVELQEVRLNSNQLNYLPERLFENNLLLKVVDFRNNFLRTVDGNIFRRNAILKSVFFSMNLLEALPKNLFNEKHELKLVDFSNNSLTSVEEDLFETNGNLIQVRFDSNRFQSLPPTLFRNNPLLKTVDVKLKTNSFANVVQDA